MKAGKQTKLHRDCLKNQRVLVARELLKSVLSLSGEFLRQVQMFEESEDLIVSTKEEGCFVLGDFYLYGWLSWDLWIQRNQSTSTFSALVYEQKEVTTSVCSLASSAPNFYRLGVFKCDGADRISLCDLCVMGWFTDLLSLRLSLLSAGRISFVYTNFLLSMLSPCNFGSCGSSCGLGLWVC